MIDQAENSDSEFVINTILSSVKTAGGDSSPHPTDDVIAKLVTFYEERLNRQKEEMKDEFMRIISSKPPQIDGQVQCETVKPFPAEENVEETPKSTSTSTSSSSESTETPEEFVPPKANVEDSDDVIEVDIRPTSSPNKIPVLHLGDFTSPQKNTTQQENAESPSSPKVDQQSELDVNSQMLMMMMNMLGGGSPHAVIFPQEVQEKTPKPQEEERQDEETPQPTRKDSAQEVEEEIEENRNRSDEGGYARPNTGTSFNTDYDPANPLYMKPPSPRNEQNRQPEGRSSRQRIGENGEYLSPSTSSASVRVQMYEKHQKQIADLKAYYEEELDELRAKLHQLEERQGCYIPASSFTSKYTNTTPSPLKFQQQRDILTPSNSGGVTDIERECASLRLKVEWLDQAYKNATQRLKDAENQVDELAAKLSAYTLRVADAGGEIEELRQECRQKDEELDRLSSKNSRLLIELDEAGRMLQIKDQSLAESDAMLNRLMREYQCLNKDFEALKAKHEGCENIVQDTKQELSNAKRQINKMAFEFKRLERDNDLLTKRLQLTTSFSVAERYSATPPVSTSRSSYQAQQAPLSAREFRDRRNNEVPPAGLSSSEMHNNERKFNNNGNKVSFGAPYALSQDDLSELSEKDLVTTPPKVSIFRDQGVQAAGSRSFSHHEEESVLLRAERELFASKQPQGSPSKGSNKSSPRKMTVSISTDFAQSNGNSSKQSPSKASLGAPSSTEQQFDRLLMEKQRVEASLNRLPAAPHNQTIRANKELLERQLEEIERRLASLRFALKKSQVIRSSIN